MAFKDSSQQPFVLYRNTWSIRSLMLRLTLLSTEGRPQNITINEKEIDIQHGEQMDQWYLCDINPKGQVPVLTHPTLLPEPVRDTLDIGTLLCHHYPELCPADYAHQIEGFLKELLALDHHVLTFAKTPERASTLIKMVQQRLERPYISEHYRKALEYKLLLVGGPGHHHIERKYILEQQQKARELLDRIAVIRKSHASDGPWIFGTEYATILDTHLVPFISRLSDVGSSDLIGETMVNFADNVRETEMWKKLLGGQGTLYVPSKSNPVLPDILSYGEES